MGSRRALMWLLDNSAWARIRQAALPAPQLDAIADDLAARRLATCAPFLLEAGYSAHSGADHAELLRLLGALPRVAIDATVEDAAIRAQHELALVGHHRLPPVDLLIAAAAHVHEVGILHCDSDYDLIAEWTSLRYESRAVIAAGDP